jgi:hypothetical protein
MALDYHDDDEPASRPRPRRLKHSVFGIASTVIAILAGLEIISVFLVVIAIEARHPGWGDEEDSPAVMLVGLMILGGFAISFVGLVLGITGLVQTDRSKTLPVLGLGLNTVIILGVIGLIVLGVLFG